ncbi:phosphate/phosphite/phosphonate ABC transporter substrate-binding protein [Vibrio sp. T187]|uniref:phosphate/phosphite/phosphonate ABC transporter substrate-binding protein n=1 Tax=Vibrio TaxID=662 RepID=UPI0010C95EA0|nr:MULTISPECIES: phosphate/phosphite/phosphonate ABC transporter substrate-binding protein [Vibrio]MBW3697810.1 phosphate/phosphite/phosphonate ABC transporter substrate-binding protein [Vibrio sp. T187]
MKILTFTLLALASSQAISQTLTFSIVPQQSASRLAAQWTPIMKLLSERTGHDIVFTTAKNIPTFEDNLAKEKYDFAYMNPYHLVEFNSSVGYLPISKAKGKQLKGIIVAKKDSGITSLEQLNDTTLAFPAPAAFAASILTRSSLNEKNVEFQPNYVSSHDSVYLSVARGFYPAGGGIVRTFNALDESVRSQLTTIYTTKGYTPHAIAHHPRVDKKIVADVQLALIELANTEQGKALLQPLKIQAFEAAESKDWDDVRALNIDLLSHKSK